MLYCVVLTVLSIVRPLGVTSTASRRYMMEVPIRGWPATSVTVPCTRQQWLNTTVCIIIISYFLTYFLLRVYGDIFFDRFIISAKWTEWMADILFSFDVCLCVCATVCARSGPVSQTSLKRLKLRTSNLTCMFPLSIPDEAKVNAKRTLRSVGQTRKKKKLNQTQTHQATRNVLDCDQSNYSSRIIFSCTFTIG